MGFFSSFIRISIIALVVAYLYQYLATPPAVPEEYFKDKWWGRGKPRDDLTTIRKFSVNVDETVLDDLKQRLNQTKFVEPISDANFENGFNGDQLRKVVDYWLTAYNWRTHEKELNKYDQFVTQIEGIDVHFIRVKPAKKARLMLPLLIVHGWPGSVYEYYKSIPKLVAVENDFAFELIIPSIPGYGFSEIPHQNNFMVPDAARVFAKLMERLGFKQFYYHGGDWGAIIGHCMAIMYPKRILGYHTTMALMNRFHPLTLTKTAVGYLLPNLIFDNPKEDFKKLFPLTDVLGTTLRESGYLHIQATKPDTVGAALTDSPAGLAAYILEKFSTWVNDDYIRRADGGLHEKFTMDELLTNVMIYWVTGTAASSVRFYKSLPICISTIAKIPIPKEVYVGLASFPNEIRFGRSPKSLVVMQYPSLVQFTDMPRGGHFAAFEEPDLLSRDVRSFIVECNRLRSQPSST